MRARRHGRRASGLARGSLAAGYLELVLGVVFWILYFAVLAPVVTLP